MEPTYLLWSGKFQGWINQSNTYGSSLEEAQRFTHREALDRARRQRSGDSFGLIPVAETDLEAL